MSRLSRIAEETAPDIFELEELYSAQRHPADVTSPIGEVDFDSVKVELFLGRPIWGDETDPGSIYPVVLAPSFGQLALGSYDESSDPLVDPYSAIMDPTEEISAFDKTQIEYLGTETRGFPLAPGFDDDLGALSLGIEDLALSHWLGGKREFLPQNSQNGPVYYRDPEDMTYRCEEIVHLPIHSPYPEYSSYY